MKKIFIIIVLLLLLDACTFSTKNTQLNKETTFLGNTQDENGDMVLYLNTEVNIITANPKYKEELVSLTKGMIETYHKLLDSHHYYLDDNNNRVTNIKILNDSIDKGPIRVDPIIIDAIKEAKTLTYLTKGYFNFTIGKLSDLYHDKLLPFDSINTDPSSNEINNELLKVIQCDELDDYIVVNESDNTIELKSKDKQPYNIDLGAFSKGYILNKVYEELLKYDTSFLLSAGSSSIVTYVNPNEDISWSVGVKNPNSTGNQLLAFTINNGAVSTSGDYENYYFLEDKTRRHHILNPYTGFPENFYRSNTFISSDACVIDALSTALFNVKELSERKEILNNVKNHYDTDIDYCFVLENLEIVMSKGFFDTLIEAYTSKEIKNINIE